MLKTGATTARNTQLQWTYKAKTFACWYFSSTYYTLCNIHSVINGQGSHSNCPATGRESDFGQAPRGVWSPFVHLLNEKTCLDKFKHYILTPVARELRIQQLPSPSQGWPVYKKVFMSL